jgi:hypothetical protein
MPLRHGPKVDSKLGYPKIGYFVYDAPNLVNFMLLTGVVSDSVIGLIGWILWGLAALYFVVVLPAFWTQTAGQTRLEVGTQMVLVLAGLVVTAVLGVSKFHLLWIFPIAYVASGAVWRFFGGGRLVARKHALLRQLQTGGITRDEFLAECDAMERGA